MKKTIAIIGSAAALSFSGAGLAAAQGLPGGEAPTGSLGAPAVDVGQVSELAEQLCGTIAAYDFLGSAEGVVPGLSGEECEANADLAVATALSGDIAGALDILRGIEAEVPGDDVEVPGDDATDDGEVDGEAGDDAPVGEDAGTEAA